MGGDFLFFIEATISGLMAGVMYALVALGFVLIFKASGIFNFAQGVLALFKGMSTLDNIMSGRNLKMSRNLFWQALYFGPARKEELEHREAVERIIDFLEIQAIRRGFSP